MNNFFSSCRKHVQENVMLPQTTTTLNKTMLSSNDIFSEMNITILMKRKVQ